MREVVPMPYGKMMPDLTGCRQGNYDYTPDWLMTYCPNCGSDNVVGLNPAFNPDVDDIVSFPSWGRWFCISCYDSWRYELEH